MAQLKTIPSKKVNRPGGGIQEIKDSACGSQEPRRSSGVHDSWNNPHNVNKYKVQIFQHELNIKSPFNPNFDSPPPRRKKNDITNFSRKSRLRILRKFNQLQTGALCEPLFITLTAAHGDRPPSEFREIFLKEFLPRLSKLIPKLVYAWRVEPHKNGYPHVHMFAWSFDQDRNLNSRYYTERIRQVWLRIINDNRWVTKRKAIKFIELNSHRQAMSYVSKYVAKEPDDPSVQITGRRWAVSTNFPNNPITEIYLSHQDVEKMKVIARKLLISKGGRYVKQAEFLDDAKNWFLWLDLDEIAWILEKVGHPIEQIGLRQYKDTGDPNDYSAEIQRLERDFPERMGIK